ncbi:MAG: GNAT family N-acetyltransferase [Actinomycetota bacterium]
MTGAPAEFDLHIRDGRSEDLKEVDALMLRAYREFESSVSPEFAGSFLEDARQVHSRLDETDLIVAERNARLIGVVTLYTDGAKYGPGWPADWSAIRLLGVDPEERGKGIGKALVTECLERARKQGVGRVGLHTTPFMQAAQRMYESMGFRHEPSIDFEYGPDFPVKGYLIDL